MGNVSEVQAEVSSARVNEAAGTSEASRKSKVSGKTIGNPQLSEKGAKYYEELQKKYSNMDFILVSKDQKEMAKSQAASYANPHKMVVLIDEEKIERMAEDENYRKQYEGIIANGANQLSQLANKLSASGAKVTGFGMQVKDGRASFFAAVDKGFKDQSARIEKRRVEKKAAKKAEEKKAAKKAAKEALEEKRAERAEGKNAEKIDDKDVEVVSADSVDELMHKVDDIVYAGMSDRIWTEGERKVGWNIDYSL